VGWWSGPWGWWDWWSVNGDFAEPLPGDAGAEFMIVSSSGQIAGSAPHFVMATGAGLWRVTSYVMSLVMFGVLL
jgi:hypothetical protein